MTQLETPWVLVGSSTLLTEQGQRHSGGQGQTAHAVGASQRYPKYLAALPPFGEISWERDARLFPLEFVTSAAFEAKMGWNDQGGAGEMEGSAQCDPSIGQPLRPGAGFPGLSRSIFGTFWADAALTTLCCIPGQDVGAATRGVSRVHPQSCSVRLGGLCTKSNANHTFFFTGEHSTSFCT